MLNGLLVIYFRIVGKQECNSFAEVHFRFGHDSGELVGAESQIVSATLTFRGLIVRLETAKGGHKVFDLAGRRRFAGFEVALNA